VNENILLIGNLVFLAKLFKDDLGGMEKVDHPGK
jgi:hypothetical protein